MHYFTYCQASCVDSSSSLLFPCFLLRLLSRQACHRIAPIVGGSSGSFCLRRSCHSWHWNAAGMGRWPAAAWCADSASLEPLMG